MARYTGADCKRCRREKTKLFLKGAKCDSPKCPIEIRPYPPGEHGRNRPKESEYLLQVREKQKAKPHLRRPGEAVRQLLRGSRPASAARPARCCSRSWRRRLDNVVYRAGFAKSRDMARQVVSHGHILVNGRKVDIPSYRVSESDIVEVAPKSQAADAVRGGQGRGGRAHAAGLDRGHPGQDADPGAHAAGARADRHARPGAADRRVLLEVTGAGRAGRDSGPAGPPAAIRQRQSRLSYSGQRGKEQVMLIAQRPGLTEEQVRRVPVPVRHRAARAGFRLHHRQLAAPYAAVVDSRCRRHQHPDRGRPARVLHRCPA